MSEPGQTVTVLVVDHHPVVREGLRFVFSNAPNISLLGEADCGEDALRIIRELTPRVVLVESALPDISAVEFLRRMNGCALVSRVLFFAAAMDREQLTHVLELGARGVVMKDARCEVLVRAIRAVDSGQYWIGHDVIADWLDRRKVKFAPRFHVTPREQEIITLVLQSRSNRDIAALLGISEDTVKRHIANVYDKLGVSSRMELALYVSAGKLKRAD